MTRKTLGSPTRHRVENRTRKSVPPHPRSVPIAAEETEPMPDLPFERGAHDPIDPDLRHRMISEAAYALFSKRGYVDGFDVDDWLTAEAEVDHVLLDRRTG